MCKLCITINPIKIKRQINYIQNIFTDDIQISSITDLKIQIGSSRDTLDNYINMDT